MLLVLKIDAGVDVDANVYADAGDDEVPVSRTEHSVTALKLSFQVASIVFVSAHQVLLLNSSPVPELDLTVDQPSI